MKQKTPTGFCRKVQKTIRLKEKNERLTGGCHPSGLNIQMRETGFDDSRELWWSPTAIHGEAGVGWYLCVQYVLPRRWVVVAVAGEHCVDDGPCSGGRRFGQSWISPEGAAGIK